MLLGGAPNLGRILGKRGKIDENGNVSYQDFANLKPSSKENGTAFF